MMERTKKFCRSAASVTVFFVLCGVAQCQTFTVIHSFQGAPDGDVPSAGLTMDHAGNLYGTARDGGSYSNGAVCELYFQNGCGTVFELAKHGSGWIVTPLFLFNGLDGGYPMASVTIGPNGSIYGSTGLGGHLTQQHPYGFGTLFNLVPGATAPRTAVSYWTLNWEYKFLGGDDGGPYPGNLIFDSNGNMYGTTVAGTYGWGNVFEFSPSGDQWTETVLYSFTGPPNDGAFPHGLVADATFDHLFGTTFKGGNNGCQGTGCGTVFELTRTDSGWTETILHAFTDGSDGGWPSSTPPIMDAAGNLYGTTPGAFNSPGTVWEMSPSPSGWTFTVLYSASGQAGLGPDGLAIDAAGNLYGTTYGDGLYSEGNVFKLSYSNGSWNYTDLYDFTGENDGDAPEGNLLVDASGDIFGTASDGGQYGTAGTVWEITP